MTAKEFCTWMDEGQMQKDLEEIQRRQREREDAEDQYFNKLSEIVEKNPPFVPRTTQAPLRQ